MDEIETSHILSDMTRAESNSTSSMLTFDPASFQSQVCLVIEFKF